MAPPSASSNVPATSAPLHQQRIDEMVAAVRLESTSVRPSLFKPASPKPQPSSRLLDQRIAEELEYMARRLEQLDSILSEDSILLMRHSGPLQSIDLMKQSLGQLAQVIAAENKEAVADRITLTELKSRLQRKALRPLSDGPLVAKQ